MVSQGGAGVLGSESAALLEQGHDLVNELFDAPRIVNGSCSGAWTAYRTARSSRSKLGKSYRA